MNTILHVEDDAAVRLAVRFILAHAGYEVCCAESAEEALVLLEGRRFDAVLTDHRMAGATGFAVVEAARALAPRPWIIASSGDQDDTLRVRYAALGADRFLTKPFGAEEVLAALGAAVPVGRAA